MRHPVKKIKGLTVKPTTFISVVALAMMLSWRTEAQTNINLVSQTNQTYLPWPPDPKKFRLVNGKRYNIQQFGKSTGLINYIGDVEVDEMISGGVICSVYWADNTGGRNFKQNIVIYNYPEPNSLTIGKILNSYPCMQVENFHSGRVSYEAYDCGVPDTIENRKKAGLPVPTQEQIDADQKLAAEKASAAQKLVVEKAAAAKKANQEKILKWNQEQADKGDSYGLLRMGERYRDGDGVPKDLGKAREYFTKASATGSPDAADALSKLNQVSTNSPATQ
jgi:hypothetical protein